MKEVVIVSAVRSPMGRAGKGQFVWTRADDLCADVVKACLARVPSLKAQEIEDLLVGCAMPEGEQGMNVARNIGFLAGLPLSTAAVTVNRFCSSSLVTIMMAAQAIMADCGDVQLSAGIESMSHVPMGGFNPSFNKKLMQDGWPEAYIGMGTTAELLAAKYGITRAEQDEFACASHAKACAAIENLCERNRAVRRRAKRRQRRDGHEGRRPAPGQHGRSPGGFEARFPRGRQRDRRQFEPADRRRQRHAADVGG